MRILPITEVLTRTSLSRRTVYSMMSAGRFPKPIQLSARRVGWRESDIDAWLETRAMA